MHEPRVDVILFWQIAILARAACRLAMGLRPATHGTCQGYVPDILDPYFVSKPSAIWQEFLQHGLPRRTDGDWTLRAPAPSALHRQAENNLWIATWFTLKNTLWGFLPRRRARAFALGLLLGRSDLLARIFYPYIVALQFDPAHRARAAHHPDVRASAIPRRS